MSRQTEGIWPKKVVSLRDSPNTDRFTRADLSILLPSAQTSFLLGQAGQFGAGELARARASISEGGGQRGADDLERARVAIVRAFRELRDVYQRGVVRAFGPQPPDLREKRQILDDALGILRA